LETAAVAVPPPGGGPERLWIIAVPKSASEPPLDPSALRGLFAGAVRRGLNPLFHVHRVLVAPEGLSRNASNKIVRRVLRERCAEVQEREERLRMASSKL
jgi:acyl-coenzyme A synthetase/AMP-(fatty) acid ligase